MNGRMAGAVALAVAAALGLAGCSSSAPAAEPGKGQIGAPASALPGGHVHGVAAAADGSKVLLGTHGGVFDVSGAAPARISPADDFMGFVGDPSDTLWASGHPGPGSKKPNPLGLLRSDDGGKTWATVSNEGVSDFHALAVTRSGLVGFDGTLKRSATGERWADVASEIRPATLAGHAGTDTVLATTERGLFASPDGGATWRPVAGAPLVRIAAFADAYRAVAVAPDGTVYASGDAGATWARSGTIGGGDVEAVTAVAPAGGGQVRVWAATTSGVRESRDGGATFADYIPGRQS
ncbi:hypothetical protein SCMU_37200 [Sinomonas cyclohexanicum]|uniref:Exo-alpha-sialidase n=1 Tax=Sinomonas cyclohexanicum TaxID=322009 RepID=A0ABM7PZY7_SINCY|nr:sialidase family protein [Corynebacterium cyclohexanicum]BCT77878.1 hypothetical protein SCMU_37200 [Corynebacterium cyclohexanicum]